MGHRDSAVLLLGRRLIIDGIKGAHSEYHWLPPNCKRSCHIISSSLGVGGLPLACPRDAEDAHTAIFVFVVIVFAVVLIITVLYYYEQSATVAMV